MDGDLGVEQDVELGRAWAGVEDVEAASSLRTMEWCRLSNLRTAEWCRLGLDWLLEPGLDVGQDVGQDQETEAKVVDRS